MARTKASGRSRHSHRFSEVPSAKIPRARFDRSHGYKTTFNGGLLIPVFCDEIIPGDTMSLNMTAFARLATPINPIMDNLYLDSFFFFVPSRLLWDNWEKFMGEQINPGDSIDFLVPQITNLGTIAEQSIYDYFGIPISTFDASQGINALPFRAYVMIYNHWFRDQNLVTSESFVTDNGPDPVGRFRLRRRGKRHDYFTSALPWPQKGDSVSVPIGTAAAIATDAAALTDVSVLSTAQSNSYRKLDAAATHVRQASIVGVEADRLYADLSNATASTVNQLRQAFQVQRLLERDARSGTRYPEVLQAHFGVTDPSMAVLQRPQYLGGSVNPVNITPIAQTSETTGSSNTPQGNLAAMGTVNAQGGFTQSFTEHGYVIGLVSVRADLSYQQGIERFWSRRTRYDYYFPVLSMLGEQAILNQEIFHSGVPATDEAVFGYQERHAEYRYKPSLITGRFRSKAASTLDPWHLSINFGSLPVLNASFIHDTPPIDRVIAVNTEPHFLFDAYFQYSCVRPMPVYGVPGLIDHL